MRRLIYKLFPFTLIPLIGKSFSLFFPFYYGQLSLNAKGKIKKKMNGKEVTKIGPKKQRVNWAVVYQYLLDYCQDTTIHGFKYIGSTDRPMVERIFWMVAFIISTIGYDTFFIY
jgi:Amiloride-sensitive sodium channel